MILHYCRIDHFLYFPNCWGLLKNVHFQDISGAIADYDCALDLDPFLSEAYYNRGTIYHKELSDPVKALADYDRAISIDPNLAAAYYVRGLLKRDATIDDLVGAASDLAVALALDPRL